MNEPESPQCPVCGLSWTTREVASSCCLPGIADYRRGLRDSEGAPPILVGRNGCVAYIYDRELLKDALLGAKGDRSWKQFTEDLGTYNSLFSNIVSKSKHDQVWVGDGVYSKLIMAVGDPPPGTLYWPPELSAPVGAPLGVIT